MGGTPPSSTLWAGNFTRCCFLFPHSVPHQGTRPGLLSTPGSCLWQVRQRAATLGGPFRVSCATAAKPVLSLLGDPGHSCYLLPISGHPGKRSKSNLSSSVTGRLRAEGSEWSKGTTETSKIMNDGHLGTRGNQCFSAELPLLPNPVSPEITFQGYVSSSPGCSQVCGEDVICSAQITSPLPEERKQSRPPRGRGWDAARQATQRQLGLCWHSALSTPRMGSGGRNTRSQEKEKGSQPTALGLLRWPVGAS